MGLDEVWALLGDAGLRLQHGHVAGIEGKRGAGRRVVQLACCNLCKRRCATIAVVDNAAIAWLALSFKLHVLMLLLPPFPKGSSLMLPGMEAPLPLLPTLCNPALLLLLSSQASSVSRNMNARINDCGICGNPFKDFTHLGEQVRCACSARRLICVRVLFLLMVYCMVLRGCTGAGL